MLDGKGACLGGQLSLNGLGVSLGLHLKASDTHFNNGSFSFQQWTIFISTMDHFHFNNGPFSFQQWTIVWVNVSLIHA